MAALRRRGLRVAAGKVGPDFIDPGYHEIATGRPGRNLDAWICRPEQIAPLAAHAAEGSDVLVIEGVMGLFDGASDNPSVGAADDDPGEERSSSTAHIARLLDAPVILVIDAASTSQSVAATVHGFATYDPRVRVAGIVLNRVGSDSHEVLLREALGDLKIPVMGALRRDDAFVWRDRHLGLVPVAEHREEVQRSIERLASAMEQHCDLDAIVDLARRAPMLTTPMPLRADHVADVRVAVASGPAFSFIYPDNLEAMEDAGAELVQFDPRSARALPEHIHALYVGGGFPEVFAAELAANEPLLADVRAKVTGGLVTLAECGGLLWLARSLDGKAMASVIPADAVMTDRLSLGYRRANALVDNPLLELGVEARGHEFHYSTITPKGDALDIAGRFVSGAAGFASPRLLASYVHFHFGADIGMAERFVAACARHEGSGNYPAS